MNDLASFPSNTQSVVFLYKSSKNRVFRQNSRNIRNSTLLALLCIFKHKCLDFFFFQNSQCMKILILKGCVFTLRRRRLTYNRTETPYNPMAIHGVDFDRKTVFWRLFAYHITGDPLRVYVVDTHCTVSRYRSPRTTAENTRPNRWRFCGPNHWAATRRSSCSTVWAC